MHQTEFYSSTTNTDLGMINFLYFPAKFVFYEGLKFGMMNMYVPLFYVSKVLL